MNPRRPWLPYIVAVLGTVGMLALMYAGGPKVLQLTGYLPLMVSVVLAAWFGGLGPGLLATVLGLGGAILLLPNPLGHIPLPSAQVALMLVRSVVLGVLVSAIFETLHRTRRRLERERAQLQSEIRRRDDAESLVRHLNEDLSRREEALLVADQRKDEFLATLAHELRNPLAPLLNGLHLIRLAGGDPELVTQSREMMERQVGQMVHLIDDLLDVSRITQGKLTLRLERLDVAGVVRGAIETSRPIIDDRSHTLSVDLPSEPVLVDGDPTRLAQVLSNLLNNGAVYTNRGGRLELRVELESGWVAIRVRDNGLGMNPDTLARVFDLYTQARPTPDTPRIGLGIGLHLSRRLVEMHGGRLEAASEGPGAGSEFVIHIPAASGIGTPAPQRRSSPASLPVFLRRVVVADDNADSAESLALLLRMAGADVRTAHDGEEALEVMALFHPDVAFIDIGMPSMSGYDVAMKTRRSPWGHGLVLIALTGWGQSEDKRVSREAGFDIHLVKPVSASQLHALLAELGTETAAT
ncbi:MAG TPA: ATP-binding protein [Candidatus Eisenbacteria bacterium]|nr:ATP-binding protein [Candidatus Eisenbacteria bacterium]